MTTKSNVPILIADDDLEDCEMIKAAFAESKLLNALHFVHNGEQLVDYLRHVGNYQDEKLYPTPGLVFLDLNMPRKSGREALAEIKSDPNLKHIPIVILTTSAADEDILRTYDIGVNSFVNKPVGFNALVRVIQEIGHYWFEIVELPKKHGPVIK